MKSRNILYYFLFIGLLSQSLAKPVAEELTLLEKASNVLEPSSTAGDAKEAKRINRQNIRIFNDFDYDGDVEELDPGQLQPFQPPRLRPSVPPPAPVLPPQQQPGFINTVLFGTLDSTGERRGGLGRFFAGLLGSSSNKVSMTDTRSNRIRRQVEEIIMKLQSSMNLTQVNCTRRASKIMRKENQTLARQEDDSDFDCMGEIEELDRSTEIEGGTEESGETDESDEKNDEPPGGGDGQGGGILGILAGLSGEGGGSDLGTLLTTVTSIITNLSGGEGFNLNDLIASAVALLGGILAGDGTNPIGTMLGIYINTILDGSTGGGAMNNGAFFGDFLSKVISGISAAGNGDADSSEEQSGDGGSDSSSFFVSFITALLGGSSSSSSSQK